MWIKRTEPEKRTVIEEPSFNFLGTGQDFIESAKDRMAELQEHLKQETAVFQKRAEELEELRGALMGQVKSLEVLYRQLKREQVIVQGILKIRQVREEQ